MATKKTLILDIQTNGVGSINDIDEKLNKVESSFKDVKTEANNAGNSIEGVTKNGGAIAILDKLTGGLASSFRDSYEATKLFNFSLKGTKTALIATGIGAFVVALGLVVAYWDEISEFITGANANLQRQIDLKNEYITKLDGELSLLDNQLESLELQGKSTKEITAERKKILTILREENLVLIDKLELQLKNKEAQVEEIELWDKIKIATLSAAGFYKDAAIASAEAVGGTKDERKEIQNLRDAIIDAKNDSIDLNDELFKINNPDAGNDDKREKVKGIGSLPTAEEAELENEKRVERFAEVFELEANNAQSLIDLNKNTLLQIGQDSSIADVKRTENEKQNAEARQKIAELEFRSKQKTLGLAAQGLSQLSNILGQETGKGKALAVAAALIDTYAAIAGQLRAFSKVPIPGFAIAQAVITGLSGFAAVKNILKVQVPNSSGGSAIPSLSSSGRETIQNSAPQFNVVGTSDTNQLAQAIGTQQQPVKAYVVSTDMTNQQQFDRTIEESATFG